MFYKLGQCDWPLNSLPDVSLKNFFFSADGGAKKLECLSLEIFFSVKPKIYKKGPKPTHRVEHCEQALVLPAKIIIVWKKLSVPNTLAYFTQLSVIK